MLLAAFNFKLSVRNFLKNRRYTTINILGLSLGLATFFLISLFIFFHVSYDKNNKHYKNIYRVDQKVKISGGFNTYPCTPFPLYKLLQHIPEIKAVVRINQCQEFLSSDKEHTFFEGNGIYADTSLFDIFDFTFIEGNPKTALFKPNAIILTENMAKKYFPRQNALGKTLRLQAKYELIVTAVIKEIPENSSLRPDFIVPFIK